MRIIFVVWAVVPVLLLLSSAIYRLGIHAVVALSDSLSLLQWCALMFSVIYMLHAEGYKGFYKAFAPRFAARVRYVRDNGSALQRIFAPVFCFGFFGATRRRLIATYLLTTMIICMVLLVSQVAQPWRGIIDAGVVAGLIVGVISIVYFLAQALNQENFEYSPEICEE